MGRYFPLGLSEYVVHDDTLAVQGSPNSLSTPVGPDSPSEEYNLDSAMGDSTSTSAFGSGELGHLGLATGRVKRVTMFKIPDLANQQLLVDAYKVLEEKQSKVFLSFRHHLPFPLLPDSTSSPAFMFITGPSIHPPMTQLTHPQDANGKSYILSLDAGIVEDPARAQGHTVIGTTEFNSLEDMRFYDEECQDHTALKARARELGLEEPPLVAYWMVRVDPGEEVAV